MLIEGHKRTFELLWYSLVFFIAFTEETCKTAAQTKRARRESSDSDTSDSEPLVKKLRSGQTGDQTAGGSKKTAKGTKGKGKYIYLLLVLCVFT